jgi:5'-3' exonuclease
VIYGFLKSISALKNEFQTDRIAFCFEGRGSKRKEVYPQYKARRGLDRKTEEEKKARTDLCRQIDLLRDKHLPRIGFRNVFHFDGYESDDIMAALAREHENVVIVTSDLDLLQCISPTTIVYCPFKKKYLTNEWFIKTYNISPKQWAQVKAIAGCSTDGVPGIYGVGEKTAIKFIRDELDPESKTYGDVMCGAGRSIIRRNRKLVELPFEGCPVPEIREDRLTQEGWNEVCDSLGMKSLHGRVPTYFPQERLIEYAKRK